MELSIYLGRMPILSSDGDIFAYELLHRSTNANHTIVDDNVKATARVLVNALNYIGLDNLTQHRPAFIKVDEKVLFDDLIFSVSPQYFVLEILENSVISPELILRIQDLHCKGYTFAINHFLSDKNFIDNFKDIFAFISYVKIDIRRDTRKNILSMLDSLRTMKVKCIAEKIEDIDDYEWSQEAGFELFEGYYFSKPQIYIKELIDPDKKILLQLLYLLKKESSLEELLLIFNNSPYLSVNLLKFIHIQHNNKNEKIFSIDQALILLGREKLSHWIELMIYAQKDDDYDSENIASSLGKTAKSRASLMEELGILVGDITVPSLPTSAYLVGILSLAEAIFQSSFEALFKQMDLDPPIAEALIDKTGLLGNLLRLCLAIEKDHFQDISSIIKTLNISKKQLDTAMIHAHQRTSRG